uniref:HMG box domain-containing protein n=1 Tax=Amphora coffeiformis TaxID=265554 RepID=A0A7S3KVP0_9STRA|mmetsp:Transcript_12376/g.25026  ORF Transcript_12376/g.25026 Transcript_12376/m.25026 type:complete len:227 (+) Transcript_12376:272-952(+)|eukprot:scaffold2179_cov165-Amphora_coffeaeformis.AAC.15
MVCDISLTNYNLTLIDSGKPKRCLTAYNIFFQQERQRLLKTLPARAGVKSKKAHGKIGFAELGRAISRSWKSVTVEQKAYYRKLAAQDKKRYQREMEEWKAKLAAQDTEVELAAPKSTPEQPQVITGSVVMDESFAPAPQEPVVSGEIRAQDMMHAMPTEDLIMLACGDTFLDNGIAPTPVPIQQVQSDPQQTNSNPKTLNKAVTPELMQPLDTDCQDFLMSAFGI